MSERLIPKGYKYSEMGVIPEDWKVTTFKEIANISKGINPSPMDNKDLYDSCSNISFARVGDITSSYKYLKNTETRLSDFGVNETYFIKSNKVLFSASGTIGKVAINKYPISISAHILVFNNVTINYEFLYYYLYSIENYWIPKSIGTAQKHLRLETINQTFIAIPSDSEQEVIIKPLTKIDDLIIALQSLIKKKEQAKRASIHEYTTGKRRLAQFAYHADGSLKGYKDSELGIIPEDWEIKRLEEIAFITKGKLLPPISIQNKDDDIIPWLNISDMNSCAKYIQKTKRTFSKAIIPISRFVEKNTLLISIIGTIGDVKITNIQACISCNIAIFTQVTEHKEFLYYLLSTLKKYWNIKAHGTAQNSLTLNNLKLTTVQLPTSKQEQAAIAHLLSTMDNELMALNKLLQKYKNMKKAMLYELLTGKIRVI